MTSDGTDVVAEHASEAGRTQPETLSLAEMTEARIDLGRRLAAWRATGLTQARLGQFTSYARSSIANIEIGRRCPPRLFWQRCDRHLAAGGALLVAFDQAQAALPQAQRSAPAEPVGVPSSPADLAPQTFPAREPVPVGRSEADAVERYAAWMLDGRTVAEALDELTERIHAHPNNGGYCGNGCNTSGWQLPYPCPTRLFYEAVCSRLFSDDSPTPGSSARPPPKAPCGSTSKTA